MNFRWITTAALAVLIALGQILPERGTLVSPPVTFGQVATGVARAVALGQRHPRDNDDDKDDDNENDNEDDRDNGEDDRDNGEDNDNRNDRDEDVENTDQFEEADNGPVSGASPGGVQQLQPAEGGQQAQAAQQSRAGQPTPTPTSPPSAAPPAQEAAQQQPTPTPTPPPPPPPPPPTQPPTPAPAPESPRPPAPAADTAPPPPPLSEPPPPLPSGSPAPAPPAPPPPAAETSGVSDGADLPISLGGDRIVVQVHPSMPAGTTIFLKQVQRDLFPPVPGAGISDFIFTIEARDAMGGILLTLPAEVQVSVHYADREVVGLTKLNATLSRLALEDFNWRPVPRQARDPMNNVVTAPIVDLGVYALHVP